jgi:hypothetical protein
MATFIANGEEIKTLKLFKVHDNHYATGKFTIPDKLFKVKIDGIDAGGHKFSRLVSSDVKGVPLKKPGKH